MHLASVEDHFPTWPLSSKIPKTIFPTQKHHYYCSECHIMLPYRALFIILVYYSFVVCCPSLSAFIVRTEIEYNNYEHKKIIIQIILKTFWLFIIYVCSSKPPFAAEINEDVYNIVAH